ncbi:hypothetical protein M3P05_15915 [Sansalvadorimonas sp. 2012CJ34-2]|uniref:Serine transporter n=1 Tax=Parendozoicomonas callyspongiae TaxID=2942213 RepID=A0ABT0PJ42_9GAMM|nr:hypothetical protein [Sansalvadorimonas sp. 2012CJ34-2]MCL6271407.1 hypothetical protein [Sansalvadorimonas sp. 2012CJ34-2]
MTRPAISSFASAYRNDLGSDAEAQASKTLKRTTMMLVGFTMLFVYSCVLTLSPAELLAAKASNLPILSVFAERTDSAVFSWLAQMVAIVAICSSFFGLYMSTREGQQGMIESSCVAPIIAAIRFIMPVYATKRVASMRQYEFAANIFSIVMGTIAITGFIASQLL